VRNEIDRRKKTAAEAAVSIALIAAATSIKQR
jgi:hypothetical protein